MSKGMWTVIHDAGNHTIECRNNKKCQVLKIQYISSWDCIYRECTLTTEIRKGKVLVLSVHTEKPLSVWLIFFPLQWHILVAFFFSFEQTTKFQLNLVEDFQSNRKSCFQDSIRGPKRKKEKKSIIRTVEERGVPAEHTVKRQLQWGSMFLHPPSLAQLITGMSLQRNTSKSIGFLLFLPRSRRKTLFKIKEKAGTSAEMQRTRWNKERKVAITFPTVLQEHPKCPTDVLTTNTALHLSELGCWGDSLPMGLSAKE